MRARLTLAAAVVALLTGLGTTAAQAAPAAAVVVASSADVDLRASDDSDGQLCVGIRAAGGESTACGNPELGTVVVGGPSPSEIFVGAAVPAQTASIEVSRAGQLLAAGPTVAGDAYRGRRAGNVRFALLKLSAAARSDGLRVRALDANGALVSVLAPGTDGELVFDRHPLLSGRYGPTRWSIGSSRSSALTPSVVDLAHETISRCADVTTKLGLSTSGSSSCIGAAPRDSAPLLGIDAASSSDDSCTPPFRLLHGIVDGSVRGVTFLLGDGRRRAARTAPLGDGEHVVYALPIPHDAAVRSMTLDRGSAGGSTTRRLGTAPLAISCATGAGDGAIGFAPGLDPFGSPLEHLPAVTPTGPVTSVAGAPSFRVADGPGDSLCLALGDRPFNALGCAVVSPDLDELLGAFDSFVSPRSFVIAVPARVASVRVLTPDGKIVHLIPTAPAPGYAGAYAGSVRFAAATVGGTRELSGIDLLDAAGTVLHSERDGASVDDDAVTRFAGRQRIAGGAGRPSLWQTNLRSGTTRTRCLALTGGPHPSGATRCQTPRTSASVLLAASCVSHRLTVAVTVAAGTRVLAGAPRIRLRHGAGLLTLPSDRALPTLTFVRKGAASRVRIDAPAGARQCGWSAAPSISLRRSK